MKPKHNISLPRILAEGAIIVVSILLAFWIDAWWAGRKKFSEDSIDELISDVWWVSNDAQWTSAPLESLVASGSLSLISNPELVQSL